MTATDPIHRPVGRSAVWLPRDVVRRSTSGAVVFGAGVRDLLGQLATGAALRRAARPFSAVGAIFGLALPAFLVTAATNGRAGVRDLLRRTLRWRVGVGWYLLAILAIPVGTLLLAPLFLGAAPLERLPENWTLLLTEFLPQLLLALVTVQFFEELGWAGFVQHRLQPRRGALKASLLVALTFAYLHLPTYLNAPVSAESALRDLSVMVIRDAVRNLFPDPDHLRLQPHRLQRPHRRHHPHLLQRSIRKSSHRTCQDHWPRFSRSPQSDCWHFSPR